MRALELDDLDRLHRWHNSAEMYQSLVGYFGWVSRKSEEEFLSKKSVRSNSEVNLAICLTETREHIGNIYLRDIDWISRHGVLHIFIGNQEHRGKGYGTEAVMELTAHAFSELGLHRVFLRVLEENQGAIRTYEKCGFVTEGVLRDQVFKGGRFQNVVVMGRLRGARCSPEQP